MKTNKNEVIEMPSIDGLDKSGAIETIIRAGFSFKEANKYWVDNRPTRGTGFKVRFYDRLVEGKMDETEFDEFLSEESANILAHKSSHNLVREAANKIWDRK